MIGRRFHMAYTIQGVRKLQARNGWSWHVPARRAMERDEEAVAGWVKEVWPCADSFTALAWRQGSRGELRSRFAALRVRPAGKAVEPPIKAAASAEQGWWDGVLPACWLLVEWPEDADAPTDYWLSNLPADTPLVELVRLAKARWRIEHHYRELKHGLGLDHFEGRSWPGWHHHVTLVTAAHAFLTEQRLAPKAPGQGSPSTRSSTPSRTS
ncbi:winged helix-turn-helix domain-containing protein [Streptomyces sp. NPDC003998]